jgi:hypothetical protein
MNNNLEENLIKCGLEMSESARKVNFSKNKTKKTMNTLFVSI